MLVELNGVGIVLRERFKPSNSREGEEWRDIEEGMIVR